MSGPTTSPKRNFLEGLATLVHRSGAEDVKKPDISGDKFKESARELSSAVESLKAKINAQREEIAKRSGFITAGANSSSEAGKLSSQSQKELQRQELEHSVASMRTSIVHLHATLGTGINEQTLATNEKYLTELREQLSGPDLDARIRAAIAERIYTELGPISWSMLMQFMERAGIQWPEPSGLLPRITEDQRALAIEHQMHDAEEFFLSQSLESGIELLRGEVKAWKRYPDPSSWLWQEVALRGVAAGIRCNLMHTAVEKLRADGDSLRAKGHQLLDEHMAKIQLLVQSGIRSLEDAEKVVQGTNLIVQNLLPDLAWEHVSRSVHDAASRLADAR